MKCPTFPKDRARVMPELATGLWRVDYREESGKWNALVYAVTREAAEESYRVLTGQLMTCPRG